MKIIEIMTKDVSTVEPDTTLEEIALLMRNEDVGAVPVLEGNELLGIVTDRDIVVRCIAEGEHPSEMCADDILTGDIETVHPDTDVKEAAELMSSRQIRRLPVVENGRLVGMVSLGDIAVRQHNETVSGETLEGVSRGVKRPAASIQHSTNKQQAKSKVMSIRPGTKTGKKGPKAS